MKRIMAVLVSMLVVFLIGCQINFTTTTRSTRPISQTTTTTTIDLSSLKDHPDFSTGDNNSGSTSTGSGQMAATVKWARYL